MDADTRLFLEQLSERFAHLEQAVHELHTPANCALAERVRALEVTGARQTGVLVTVGAIAGFIGSLIVAGVGRLLR